MNIELNDIVITKKSHPCGCNEWQVIRTGVDYKIKCSKCGHIVMLSREKLNKAVKEIKSDRTN